MKIIKRGNIYIDESGNASFSYWTVDWEGRDVDLDKLLQWAITHKGEHKIEGA